MGPELGHEAQHDGEPGGPTGPQFWAQLDSKVYTSLAEAQHLLERQSQLMAQLEAEPVFGSAKDDVTFSSIAVDIMTSFTI